MTAKDSVCAGETDENGQGCRPQMDCGGVAPIRRMDVSFIMNTFRGCTRISVVITLRVMKTITRSVMTTLTRIVQSAERMTGDAALAGFGDRSRLKTDPTPSGEGEHREQDDCRGVGEGRKPSFGQRGARKMTRDVKVGLLVSCSFLCLVGVVVTTKLREKGLAKAKHSAGPVASVPNSGGATGSTTPASQGVQTLTRSPLTLTPVRSNLPPQNRDQCQLSLEPARGWRNLRLR